MDRDRKRQYQPVALSAQELACLYREAATDLGAEREALEWIEAENGDGMEEEPSPEIEDV